jgi:hypothetical protein
VPGEVLEFVAGQHGEKMAATFTEATPPAAEQAQVFID